MSATSKAEPVPLDDAPEAFRSRIAERLGALRHAEAVEAGAGQTAVEGEADGATLRLIVDEARSRVVAAGHSGSLTPAEAAVLDGLCAFALGAPVREVTEHGLGYAMQRLLDPDLPRPVPGILTPRNAGRCFEKPLKLVRSLRAAALARWGRPDGINYFDRPYSAAWKARSNEEKRGLIEPLVAEFKADRNISAETFEIYEIDKYDRVVIMFADGIPVWSKPDMIMDLESWLRRRTGERIEVFTEIAKDANRIRRL